MHAVRTALLRMQADAAGLPVYEVSRAFICSKFNQIHSHWQAVKAAVCSAAQTSHMHFSCCTVVGAVVHELSVLRPSARCTTGLRSW